ncbi:MAG: hypothetical protein RLO02_10655 [Roseitalea porphyridii]|jgi:hypothetical protein
MFMDYASHRADRRRFNLASSAVLIGGFVFATLIALVGLASAAAASPVAMLDTDALATMLAAPSLHPAPFVPSREMLLGLMGAALFAMSAGAFAFWRGLEQDWRDRPARTR